MRIPELYELYLRHPVVCTDSRTVEPGSIFFALRGEHFNGNLFAGKALDTGAAYAVVDDPDVVKDQRYLLVRDVLDTLQELARHHRNQLGLPVIGITGSNGKTTTKELIHAALQTRYNTLATTGNLNNHIGVPLTLLRIRPDTEIAIIEMGANHPEEIRLLCSLATPTHGIITNVGRAHLEGFGGFEGVKKTKKELYDSLENTEGTAFVNKDNSDLADMSRGLDKIIWYGTGQDPQVSGALKVSAPHLQLEWAGGDKKTTHRVNTRLTGNYNFENILAAICIADYFKVEPGLIAKGIGQYKPSSNRSQELRSGTNRLLLDAYNANPSSMQAAIQNLALSQAENKLAILGDMFELGSYAAEEHEVVLQKLEAADIRAILIGREFYKRQKAKAPKTWGRKGLFSFFENTGEAETYLKQHPVENTLILIKGSRGMRLEQLVSCF